MNKPEIIKLIDNRWSSEAIINLIKEKGYDLNATDKHNNTPLLVALIEGWYSLADYLIDNGADISHKGETGKSAFYFAAHGGYFSLLKKLHKLGEEIESPSSTGITSLMAVGGGAKAFKEKNGIRTAKFIDGKFVTPNDAEYDAANAVTYENFSKIMDYLIENGANVNAQTYETKHTPLTYCCFNNIPDLGKKLIDAGAYINHQDKDGMTSLHWACRKGFSKVVKMLLDNNANPNLPENYGFTPLHEAVENKHKDIVQLLLDNGADKSIKIQKGFGNIRPGFTAFDIAKVKDFRAIKKLLK